MRESERVCVKRERVRVGSSMFIHPFSPPPTHHQTQTHHTNKHPTQLNAGGFDPSDPALDVHVVATLLKAWFRECPDPLLGPLDHAWLARVAAMTDLEEVRSCWRLRWIGWFGLVGPVRVCMCMHVCGVCACVRVGERPTDPSSPSIP